MKTLNVRKRRSKVGLVVSKCVCSLFYKLFKAEMGLRIYSISILRFLSGSQHQLVISK